MRSLWLASAAIIVSTGVAMAQTSTSTPAPTGAPNAPVVTTPGASPGNTAPSTPGGAGGMSSGAAGGTGTPAPTGAPNAATVTKPGASPGNMAPTPPATTKPATTSTMTPPTATVSPSKMAPAHTAMSHPMMSHHMMMMPADGSPGVYLHIAKMAVKHGDKMTADEALSRAETRMLDRAVPAGDIAADDTPAINSIEMAHKAVDGGMMTTATKDINMAMQQSGMADSAMMPATGTSMAHSSMAMPNRAPSMMHGDSSGGAPAPGETSDSGAVGGGNSIVNKDPMKPTSSP